MRAETDPTDYLVATTFVDSEAENVVAFARHVVGDETDEVARAVRLYYAVRDGIAYPPYLDYRSLATWSTFAIVDLTPTFPPPRSPGRSSARTRI